MKKVLLFIVLLLISSTYTLSQTVDPFVFGQEYRNINDMDVMGEKVAVVSTTINNSFRPVHLAIFENNKWTIVPPTFLNNGVLDTIHSTAFPKVRIAPNGDVWVLGHGIYRYYNERWQVFRIKSNDSNHTEVDYKNISVDSNNLATVVVNNMGESQIFVINPNKKEEELFEHKFVNRIFGVNSNYPYEPVTSINGYSIANVLRSTDPTTLESDLLINTPDDTILEFVIPTPNSERSGRRVTQMFAPHENEVWILTDNSIGRKKIDSSYTCCAGIYVLRNLKEWELISDGINYPINFINGLNISPLSMNKISSSNYEFLMGMNPSSNLNNEVYLYNSINNMFSKTDWDIIVKNSVGYRSSNQQITEYRLAQILESLSKNEKSTIFQSFDQFIKFKIDQNGNRWFMAKSFILKTPPIMHPTTVSENDLNQQFRIVPNPASQTISLKGKTELLKHIEILNLQGETLIKVDGEFTNISIRPFANGVYFVKSVLKDGRVNNLKFIKQ